jgi:hypothetical protein
MNNMEQYKKFVDDMVELRPSVLARWVQKDGWPKLPENENINRFLDQLTSAQKVVLSEMLQQARDSGIHDILVYLNEKMLLEGLRISIDGSELPIEPFGTELHYDWVCRRDGDEWPENE